MNNLKVFASVEELRKNIKLNCNEGKKIGFGVEGITYLSNDGMVIKEIQNQIHLTKYNEDIITTSKYNLDTFIFPEELYIYDNLIYGYKAKHFENDLFCNLNREEDAYIDLEKLLEAKEKMIEDIKVLTKDNYKLNDLFSNILFDGEKLVGIDTLHYSKDENITLDDNIRDLNQALNFRLYKLESKTGDWNMPLDNKINKLIEENGTSKILIKPLVK